MLKSLRFLVPSIDKNIFKLKNTQLLYWLKARSLRKYAAKPCVPAAIKTSRLIVKLGINKTWIGSDQLLLLTELQKVEDRVRRVDLLLFDPRFVNGRWSLPCKDHDSSCDFGYELERFKFCKEKNATPFLMLDRYTWRCRPLFTPFCGAVYISEWVPVEFFLRP